MEGSRFLRSGLLSDERVLAGFSTRRGGDDLGGLAREAGFSRPRLFMVTQVHGREVVVVDGETPPEVIEARAADALVTRTPGVALAVRTADCVPVLFTMSDASGGRVAAAAHAGWRGQVAGVLEAALEALGGLSSGGEISSVRAAVGPAIGPCCFEVGQEVAEAIAAATTGSVVTRGPRGKPQVDLVAAAVFALTRAGVSRDRVELVGPCTRCAASMFHSYRREGPGRGRQFSFIFLK